MGGDTLGGVEEVIGRVSIHAPAWGATGMYYLTISDGVVSIHAPAWGATTSLSSLDVHQSFNPRPRMGGDGTKVHGNAEVYVSIHAPAWGATYFVTHLTHTKMKFQSTPPHGGRRIIANKSV